MGLAFVAIGFSVFGSNAAMAAPQQTENVFLQASREILRPLTRAEELIEKKEYSGAISILGEILAAENIEDYLIIPSQSQDKRVAISLRSRARDLLGSIPPRERKVYETLFGIQAEQDLENAIEQNQTEALSNISQRYFYSNAGYSATMLLGHQELEQGRPLAAAFLFRRIVDCDQARKIHDPEVSVLLATSWVLSNYPDRAEQVLNDLKQRQPRGSIRFNDVETELFDESQDPVLWLKKMIGDSPLVSNRMVKQWLMFGGNPQRTAQSGEGAPLQTPIWRTPTINDPDIQNLLQTNLKIMRRNGKSTIPGAQPLAVGNTIVMRTQESMIGVDFGTGKRVWVFPPPAVADFFNSARIKEPESIQQATNPLIERVFQDAVYGRASSDGQRIFVIPRPGYVKSRPRQQVRGLVLSASPARVSNELVAVDVSRQGTFLWEVGGESGLDEPRLAGALFLGAPLPLGGSLYAICKQRAEIRLVVLDPKSGKLQWSHHLASTESLRTDVVNLEPSVRLPGATPSYADGVLVCPTTIGAMVAVDLATRSLLWGCQYSASSSAYRQFRSTSWGDASVLIDEGKLFFVSPDKPILFCQDLITGKVLWSVNPFNAGQFNYLASVDQGRLMAVSGQTFEVCDVDNKGKQIWKLDLLEYGRPSGHGYLNNGFYYLPTTEKKLVKIDLQRKSVAAVFDTDEILGNLICHRGTVISHSATHVSAYPQDKTAERMIVSAKEDGALTSLEHMIDGQLLHRGGDLNGAISAVYRSYQMEPNFQNENLLLDLSLQMLGEDFDRASELISKYEPLMIAKRRSEYLAVKVDGLIADRRFELAAKALEDMILPSDLFLELRNNFLNHQNFDESTDEEITIRYDRWIRSRLRMIAAEDATSIEKLTQKIVSYSKDNSDDLQATQRFDLLELISPQLIPSELRFEVATELIADNENLRAIQMLESILGGSDGKDSGERQAEEPMWQASAAAELAKLIFEKTKVGSLRYHSLLESRFADTKTRSGKTGSEIAREMAVVGANPIEWKTGAIKTESIPLSNARRSVGIPNQLDLVRTDDPSHSKLQFEYFSSRGEFRAIDEFGSEIARLKLPASITRPRSINPYLPGEIQIYQQVALINFNNDLFAVDWLRFLAGDSSAFLWHARKGSPQSNFTSRPKQDFWGVTNHVHSRPDVEIKPSGLGRDGVCFAKEDMMRCVDVITGETLWTRPLIEFADKQVGKTFSYWQADDEHLVVLDNLSRVLTVALLEDGTTVSSRVLKRSLGGVWEKFGRQAILSRRMQVVDRKPGREATYRSVHKMTMFDMLTHKTVWEKEYPKDTVASVFENRLLVVATGEKADQPDDGDKDQYQSFEVGLEFFEMPSGKLKHELEFEFPFHASTKLSSIQLVEQAGLLQVRLHTSRFLSGRGAVTEPYKANLNPLESREFFWDGYMQAFEFDTLKPAWPEAVRVPYFQFLGHAPKSSPVIWMGRMVSFDTEEIPIGQRNCQQLVAVDARNGQLIYEELDKDAVRNQRAQKFGIDPANQTADVTLPLRMLRCTFSEEGEPAKFVQLDNESLIKLPKIVVAPATPKEKMNALERDVILKELEEIERRLQLQQQESRERIEAEKKAAGDKK